MTLVIVVVAAVILVGVVGRVALGGGGRRGSANDYEHAMDTLARMSGRPNSSATGRGWMGQPAEPVGPAGRGPSSSPRPNRPGPVGPDTARPQSSGPGPGGPGVTPVAALRSSAGRGPSLSWMRPASLEPGRRAGGRDMGRIARLAGGAIGLIVLVIATVTVVSLAAGRTGRHTNPTAAHTTQPAATAGGSRSAGARTRHPATTTTAPSFQVTAVSNDSSGAVYNAPTTDPYMLSFTTTGPCWVRVTDSSGTIMFEKTLPTGSAQTLSVPGPVEMRVGNAANVAVQVDGKPVVVPYKVALPYNLTFQAA